MKNFTAIHDVDDLKNLVSLAISLKKDPLKFSQAGRGKSLTLLFFNKSLRTRLSTRRAAMNLGLNVTVMQVDKEGWKLEFEDGVIMHGESQEHIREAAKVISAYSDIIGIRSFPELQDRLKDEEETVLRKFMEFATVPVLSLESALRHPLQSLADLVTIEELKKKERPRVVLTWAPHPKALPQAVPNSFVEWMKAAEMDLVITHPPGLELSAAFIEGVPVICDQAAALSGADFVYVKNWSSYADYGKSVQGFDDWIMTKSKLENTDNARLMHCLPVRRNVVIADDALDSEHSVVIRQAANRTFAAQAVLLKLLQHG